MEHTEEFLNTASRARYAFKNGDKQTKREILRSIGSNMFLEGGKLRFEFRKPFDILLKEPLKKGLIAVAENSENANAAHQKRTKKSFSGAYISEWLHRLESIARYFAFEKGAYCPNLRLEERMASGSDEWIMVKK